MDHLLHFATDRHADQICAIWAAGWHEAHAKIVPPSLCKLRTMASFGERTLENLRYTRVALGGSEVLGFCMTKEDELYQMYVAPGARGAGVAQALMSDAESRILATGHCKAWLACAVGNERAAAFYEKSGWINSGLEVVDLDTSTGNFPLEVWRFEKDLHLGTVG